MNRRMQLMNAARTSLIGLGLAVVAAGQVASAQNHPSYLMDRARAFGNLVGYALYCGVNQDQVSKFVSANVGDYMPQSDDPNLNATVESEFDTAMRRAAINPPPGGCGRIVERVTRPG